MTKGMYRHSGDAVTDRIIGEFEDFVGWTDEPPLCRGDGVNRDDEEFGRETTKRGRSSAARKQEPLAKRQESSGKLTPKPSDTFQNEPPMICPSCGCSLPEPKHLVSNALIELRRRARATEGAA